MIIAITVYIIGLTASTVLAVYLRRTWYQSGQGLDVVINESYDDDAELNRLIDELDSLKSRVNVLESPDELKEVSYSEREGLSFSK